MAKNAGKSVPESGKDKPVEENGIKQSSIQELGKMAREVYKEIPGKLIEEYSSVVRKHDLQRKEWQNSLDEVPTELLKRWKKPVLEKKNSSSKSTEAAALTVEEREPAEAGFIVPKGCESEFDTSVLSLTNRRAKYFQHFVKLMINNHPFKNSFVKNNWFTGQALIYRQEWRPAGFGLGELVKSFSLLPAEETSIELTVWEKTRSEIESIDQSSLRASEQEISQSTDSRQVTTASVSKFKWHAEGSGGINIGIASAGGGGGASGSSSQQAKSMVSLVQKNTRTTSSSISQSRSVSVAFAREAGRENKTVRQIKNSNQCHTVTYNFFQLLKIYDLVMTYEAAPFMLLFPTAKKHLKNSQIMEMYSRIHEAFTDFASPYAFITQYFAIDAEAGKALGYGSTDPAAMDENSGTALRFVLEPDPENPAAFIRHLMEGLIYFLGLIVGESLSRYEMQTLLKIVEEFLENDILMRREDMREIIDSVEILTPGIYVDSMLGRCSACEEYIDKSRSYELAEQKELIREYALDNMLMEKEVARRQALLDQNILDPFDDYYNEDMDIDDD